MKEKSEGNVSPENLFKLYGGKNVDFDSDEKLLASSNQSHFSSFLGPSQIRVLKFCLIPSLMVSLVMYGLFVRFNVSHTVYGDATNSNTDDHVHADLRFESKVNDALTDEKLLKLASENHQSRPPKDLGVSEEYVRINTHGKRLKVRRENMQNLDKVRVNHCGPITPEYLAYVKQSKGAKLSKPYPNTKWRVHRTRLRKTEYTTPLYYAYKKDSVAYINKTNVQQSMMETNRFICEAPHPTLKDTKVSVERLGPFSTKGGYDWSSVYFFQDIWNLQSTIEKSTIFVVGTLFAPVHADGSIISYPPLHVHHAHIYPYDIKEMNHKVSTKDAEFIANHHVLIQTHGDGECKESQGGKDCLLHQLPNDQGYRVVNSSGFTGNFEINDVRNAGSESLEFFVDVVLIWTKRKRVETTFMQMGNPILGNGWMTYLFPLDQNSNFIYYRQTNTVLGSGTMTNFIMHTHMRYTDSVYIFKGNHVYSRLEEYRKRKNATIPYIFECHGETLESEKREILRLILATKAVLVCEATKPSMDLYCENDDKKRCIYRDKRFDLNCRESVRLNQGDTITVIAFNHVRNISTIPLSRKSPLNKLATASTFGEGYAAHQHTFFRADFVSDLAREGKLKKSTGNAARDIATNAYAPPAQFNYEGWPDLDLPVLKPDFKYFQKKKSATHTISSTEYDKLYKRKKFDMIKNCSIPISYDVNLPWEV